MEEANEGRRSAFMEDLTLKLENCPKDLLQRFISGNPNRGDGGEEEGEEEEEDAEEIELNLGLSLGGRFGIDRSAKNKLIRSSSIACSIATPHLPRVANFPALVRTSSLPAETEEEWRKRKELQTLRRLAAKRRRSEKQRNSRALERDPSASAGAERSGFEDDKKELKLVSPVGALPPPPGFPAAAAAVSRLDLSTKGKGGSGGDLQGFGIPTSQGSAESQGGSSAEMSESESKPLQGSSSCVEARSPASNPEAAGSSGTKINESSSKASGDSPSKKATHVENRGKEVGANAMEDMPCVFTKGDGPEGRRIEGILYKYGKGQEVRIMCVCHGRFLSPAEFVEHAGGTDVAHPLRHIVVNPSAASFL